MPASFVAVRDVPVGELTRFPGNPRRGDVAAIRSSLRRHGQYRSLVVRDTGTGLVVLAGNHTLDALTAEGSGSARCEVLTCTDDEARRINLADNRLAELGGYEDADLAALLGSLDGDFSGTGWAQEDLDALLGEPEPPDGDPDDAPEPPAEPVTRPGDLYRLGPHRLLCGDATNPDDLKRVTDGLDGVGIVYTDPPYGVDIVSSAGKVGAAVGYPFGGARNGKQGSKGTVRTTAYRPVAGNVSTDVAADAYRLLAERIPGRAPRLVAAATTTPPRPDSGTPRAGWCGTRTPTATVADAELDLDQPSGCGAAAPAHVEWDAPRLRARQARTPHPEAGRAR